MDEYQVLKTDGIEHIRRGKYHLELLLAVGHPVDGMIADLTEAERMIALIGPDRDNAYVCAVVKQILQETIDKVVSSGLA